MIFTARQLDRHRRYRPPEYWAEIAPAKVRDLPDGGAEYDQTHPAWLAAWATYRPGISRKTRQNANSTGGGCSGCGGKSLTDLRADPAAMEAALAE